MSTKLDVGHSVTPVAWCKFYSAPVLSLNYSDSTPRFGHHYPISHKGIRTCSHSMHISKECYKCNCSYRCYIVRATMDVSMNATANTKAGKGCKRTSGLRDCCQHQLMEMDQTPKSCTPKENYHNCQRCRL